MRTGLAVLLGIVLAAASANGAEPPKKAPAKATAATSETSETKQSAATADQAPEAKPADAAVDTKGTEPSAPAKRKVPTVSRVAPPSATPAAAHKPASAAPAPEPPSGHASGAAQAPPTSASGGHGGYVATGARPKASASTAGKAKPMVSGLTARPADAHPPAAHDSTAAPLPVHATPAGSKPQAADHADATPGHEVAGPAPVSAARPAPRGLARLSDVHERIAAALASLKDDASRADGRADADATAGGDGHATRSRSPRITLRWPAPRWRVMWASLPSSAGSLPARSETPASVTALVAAPAPRLPAPSPVSAQPPDRH